MKKSYGKLLCSKKMAEKATYVFVDGECIKAKGKSLNGTFTEDEALATGRTVLIQKGQEVTIYSENDQFSFFQRLISYDNFIREAFISGKVILLQNPTQPVNARIKLPMGFR